MKLVRITTAPLSLKLLLPGQMKFMSKNGFEVVMVSSEGPEKDEVIRKEECRHQVIPMTRKITPFGDLRALWKLYRFFRKERPDIVHSHTPKAGLLGMLAARMAGVRIRVHTIAGLRFMTSTGMTRRILVAMEKLTARAATQVWPNSYSLRDYIIKNRLVTPSKLEVIGHGSSNGIDLNRYSKQALKPEKLAEIKASVDYREDLIYFVSVGRIVHDKGIDELLGAFVKVYEKNNKTRLILVGSFEDELDPISDKAREILKSHPGILQPGWSNMVEYFLDFSFAMVHPSHREGFPNVLLQAGAMHCPIICSHIEGNIDIVENEVTGWLFEVKNESQLQACMERALAEPGRARDYAIALRKKVEQFFDQPVLHQLLKYRYLELIDLRNNRKTTSKGGV